MVQPHLAPEGEPKFEKPEGVEHFEIVSRTGHSPTNDHSSPQQEAPSTFNKSPHSPRQLSSHNTSVTSSTKRSNRLDVRPANVVQQQRSVSHLRTAPAQILRPWHQRYRLQCRQPGTALVAVLLSTWGRGSQCETGRRLLKQSCPTPEVTECTRHKPVQMCFDLVEPFL